jgi:hypothetical protein
VVHEYEFLAHSQNRFQHPAGVRAALFLDRGDADARRDPAAAAALSGGVAGHRSSRRRLAVAIGLAGVILHLDSRFFYERTIRSLSYAAPFAAPLAYTGLGLLLIANRMVDAPTREWPMWMLLLALGGFVGNFVFILTDHAQNAFFNPIEWLPLATSAFAIDS